MLRNQDRAWEVCNLLAPVYDWFTEGFDTADLKDAKVLYEELKWRADASPPTSAQGHDRS